MKIVDTIVSWVLIIGFVVCWALAFLEPLPARAELGDFSGYMDYVCSVSVPAATASLGTTAVYAVDFAALALCSYAFSTLSYDDNVYPTIAGQGACLYGTYVFQGVEYPGIMFTYSNMSTGNQVAMPLFSSPHLIVNAGMQSSTPVTIRWLFGGIPNNSTVGMSVYAPSNVDASFSVDFIGGGTSTTFNTTGKFVSLWYSRSAPNWGNSLPTASAYTATLYDNIKPALMSGLQQYDLPVDFDPADIQNVWNNEFLPFLEQYPELEPYLPEPYVPDTPYEPIYPSEYVTGLPKSWTVENPPLPTAPHIDFGQGDFDFSKPIEYLEEVVNEAEALDFWWWLSEKTFKRTGLYNYFLAFITLGFAMFALWRWGS